MGGEAVVDDLFDDRWRHVGDALCGIIHPGRFDDDRLGPQGQRHFTADRSR
jgi:hypothetical protein